MLRYVDTGVDYDQMDPFKRLCQQLGASTAGNLPDFLDEVPWTRGESVQVRFNHLSQLYEGHVNEGLGTKCIVSDEVGERLGWHHYRAIAKDTLAMALNDAATLAIRPTVCSMHLAVGSGDWFKNEERIRHLVEGWVDACNEAGCSWPGGETPTLRNIVYPDAAVLACAVDGYAKPSGLVTREVNPGDRIWLFRSTGIHANGLTLARDVAALLDDGYLTLLDDGRTYAEHLLEPTVLYGPLVQAVQDAGVKIGYNIHITGHGWRKLMRLPYEFDYVIKRVFEPQPIFKFIQKISGQDDRSMYNDLNMGAGWAMYLPEEYGPIVEETAARFGIECLDAGYITKTGDPEAEARVIIEPLGITFTKNELKVR